MNKKQQFFNFLENTGTSDYVPFQPILMQFAANFNGNNYGEFASDHKVLVESNIKALEHFDLDWVELISDPYRETSAFGANIEYQPHNVPKCTAFVKTMEDVKSLKIPNIYKAPRTLDRIRGAELYQKKLKGNIPVFGWVEGPLAEACDLVGVTEMLIMLMMEPEFCDVLMDKCVVVAKEFAKAQIDAGCDVIGIGDAICSQIDIDLYNRFVKHRHKALVVYIQSLGCKAKLHICGNITHLLPSIKDLGLDILDIDWQVNFDETFQIMGPKVAICGNINPVKIMEASTAELIQITNTICENQKGKKFILSGGCEISVLTPPKNLKTMGMVVKEKL